MQTIDVYSVVSIVPDATGRIELVQAGIAVLKNGRGVPLRP